MLGVVHLRRSSTLAALRMLAVATGTHQFHTNALGNCSGSACSSSCASSGSKYPEFQQPEPRSSAGRRSGWTWALALATGSVALVGIATAEQAYEMEPSPLQDQSFHLLDLSTRKKIFFMYEKRIRDFSTEAKVFQYFSTIDRDQQKYMSPDALLRSMVAVYPPESSAWDRSGALQGEHVPRIIATAEAKRTEFFRHFDVDGDGAISFMEWLLIKALTSIPEADAAVVFDILDADDSGGVSLEEFVKMLEELTAHSHVLHPKTRGQSTKVDLRSNMRETAIMRRLFGPDGTGKMSLATFQAFLSSLHRQLVQLEFWHYDWNNNGLMEATDWARSLISSFPVTQVDKYLQKAANLPPNLKSQALDLEGFQAWANIRRRLHSVAIGLQFHSRVYGHVGRSAFKCIVRKAAGVQIADWQVDVVFHLFGVPQRREQPGVVMTLDIEAFTQALWRREGQVVRGLNETVPLGRVTLRDRVMCLGRCMGR